MKLKGSLKRKKYSEQCLFGKLIISKLRTSKPSEVSTGELIWLFLNPCFLTLGLFFFFFLFRSYFYEVNRH